MPLIGPDMQVSELAHDHVTGEGAPKSFCDDVPQARTRRVYFDGAPQSHTVHARVVAPKREHPRPASLLYIPRELLAESESELALNFGSSAVFDGKMERRPNSPSARPARKSNSPWGAVMSRSTPDAVACDSLVAMRARVTSILSRSNRTSVSRSTASGPIALELKCTFEEARCPLYKGPDASKSNAAWRFSPRMSKVVRSLRKCSSRCESRTSSLRRREAAGRGLCRFSVAVRGDSCCRRDKRSSLPAATGRPAMPRRHRA